MVSMIRGTASFHGVDIGNWDTSSVIYMTHTFSGATKFNSDVSCWNVTNLLFMKSTFEGARVFNIDLSELDVYNILVFDFMFFKATLFYQSLCWTIQDSTETKSNIFIKTFVVIKYGIFWIVFFFQDPSQKSFVLSHPIFCMMIKHIFASLP